MNSLVAGLPLAAAAIASCYDLRTREIPDWIPLGLGLAAVAAVCGGCLPISLVQCAAGAIAAGLLTVPFAWNGGIGGGDVKFVIALGAWLGPVNLVAALFWVALLGALCAMLAAAFRKSDFPYAPAIFLGVAVHTLFPGALRVLAGL